MNFEFQLHSIFFHRLSGHSYPLPFPCAKVGNLCPLPYEGTELHAYYPKRV
jgi:hypothetical protein